MLLEHAREPVIGDLNHQPTCGKSHVLNITADHSIQIQGCLNAGRAISKDPVTHQAFNFKDLR